VAFSADRDFESAWEATVLTDRPIPHRYLNKANILLSFSTGIERQF